MTGQGRSITFAQRGMIATDHTLASAAGLQVLQRGGNAIDAATCAAAVLGVVLPMMGGLGGDTFIVYYEAASGRVGTIVGSGAAPRAATLDYFTSRGHHVMPPRGMLSPSVPGAVDAMAVSLARWGSGRFTLGQLLEPAIEYAERGFPVAENEAGWFAAGAETLSRYPSSARVYLANSRAPRAGEILVQADLGRSLRTIAEQGARALYEGDLAARLAEYAREHGGLLDAHDLAAHTTEFAEPASTTHRDFTIHTAPPPSQGFVMLEMINILAQDDLGALPWGSPQAIHLAVEAKKLAFADRLAYVGDPRFIQNPLPRLLSADYARHRRRALDPLHAQDTVAAGAIHEQVGETTAFVVADAAGNVCSYITSLSNGFGCGEVADGTGILLNNRAGRGFSLVPGHPNAIAPGKRTMHTLMAFLATRQGRPFLAWATRGGDGQAQWDFQVWSDVVHHGMNIQEAVERPRWLSFPASDPSTIEAPYELRMEAGFAPETYEGLRRLGHRVVAPRPSDGGVQVIMRDREERVYGGASDPRADGCAIGF